MKFSAPLALFAAGAAVASPLLIQRQDVDISDYTRIANEAKGALQSLDDATLAYDGGDVDKLGRVTRQADETMQDCTDQAEPLAPMDMDQAQAFQPLATELDALGFKWLGDFDAKVPAIERACKCDEVLDFAAPFYDTMVDWSDTMFGKMPEQLQPQIQETVGYLHGNFSAVLDKLRDCSEKDNN